MTTNCVETKVSIIDGIDTKMLYVLAFMKKGDPLTIHYKTTISSI